MECRKGCRPFWEEFANGLGEPGQQHFGDASNVYTVVGDGEAWPAVGKCFRPEQEWLCVGR